MNLTVDDYINEAKAKVLATFAKPQEPDWGLDQSVRAYNEAIEVLHRALNIAEQDARAAYLTSLAPAKTARQRKGQ